MLSLVAIFSVGGWPDETLFAAAGRTKATIERAADSMESQSWLSAAGQAVAIVRAARSTAVRPYGAVLHDDDAYTSAVPQQYAEIVANASQAHGVDARLIAAVALQESRWNPDLVSTAGAAGVMQLMPETAEHVGVSDAFDARQNIAGGTRYLRALLDAYHGNLDLTLAAYNAGPTAVARYGGIPPYAETRHYVAAVKATYASLRAQ
jgi:soluble lytic murein transglycosylase-like protein